MSPQPVPAPPPVPARPGPLRWLAYAFGARLPAAYGAWVLHDLTARTWFLRHLARAAVQAVPAGLLALLPGPVLLKVSIPLFVLVSSVFVSALVSPMIREKRLYQHGFLPEIVLARDERG